MKTSDLEATILDILGSVMGEGNGRLTGGINVIGEALSFWKDSHLRHVSDVYVSPEVQRKGVLSCSISR